MKHSPSSALLTAAVLSVSAATLPAAGTVKVILMAGQSNMQGQVQRELIDFQASDPKTSDLFRHLRKDNQWMVRDDVFIKFLGRHGGLTVGYGSGTRTGVELEFGSVLGEACSDPVLLIKAAWGGHSLYKLFRSPSAGIPEDRIRRELEDSIRQTKEKNARTNRSDPLPSEASIRADYGSSYRNMLAEVKETFDQYETLFPQLKGTKPELAGFVWFQGWNDQYNGAETEYEANLKCLIRDVRNDLKAPDLPVVIGVMGQNGSKPASGPMKVIQDAQLAMEQVPEFKGTVKAVRTDVLVDKAAEALYPHWQKDVAAWQKVGSDHGYHYLGSAIWHLRIGRAFAEAMRGLMKP